MTHLRYVSLDHARPGLEQYYVTLDDHEEITACMKVTYQGEGNDRIAYVGPLAVSPKHQVKSEN